MAERIAVIGLAGTSGRLSLAARRAITEAALLVGAPRHLEAVGRGPAAKMGSLPQAAVEEPGAGVGAGSGEAEVEIAAVEAGTGEVEVTPMMAKEATAEAIGATEHVAPVMTGPPEQAEAQGVAEQPEPGAARWAVETAPSPTEPSEPGVSDPQVGEPQPASDGTPMAPTQRVIALGIDGLDVSQAMDTIAAESGPVCVLASGDPGFFGILRPLAERFGPGMLDVHPAPSSVSLAFSRLGLAWDDAVVVSAHGRPLASAARAVLAHPKVAVLTSPDATPQQLGRALMDLGVDPRRVAVCSRLGEPDEEVRETDLVGLTGRPWDPLSVVVLLAPGAEVAPQPVLAWGLSDEGFDHRGGMLTRAEVRAVALGKLALPAQGVLWDVGAGSGSVAVECARLRPGLRVIAIEARHDDVDRVTANAVAHRANVEVVQGTAPGVLAGLPDPDRVFVGGGGLAVLDAVLARLRPGGQVVATYAALDRAAAAAERLGWLVQMGVARGRRLPDGGLRLAAENPVFVVWGPRR